MLRITLQKGTVKVLANTYQLSFPADRPFALLDTPQGERLAELFVLSSVHTLNGLDDTTELETVERAPSLDGTPAGWRPPVDWEIVVHPFQPEDVTETLRAGRSIGPVEEVAVSLNCASSVWKRKTYTIRCTPDRFTYEVVVEGRGQLDEVNYFGGYSSALPRWGSGFFGSGQAFRRGFSPEPNSDEVYFFQPGEGASIDLMGVPLPGRGDWFFTPPPFCFAFESRRGWAGMGVEAMVGENRFTRFTYHGKRNSFHLSLSYEGYTQINGWYMLPAIGFNFGDDQYCVLQEHISALQTTGYVPRSDERSLAGQPPAPGWWKEPIFCGWGAQCYLSTKDHGRAPDYARQEHYEQFLAHLESKQIHPGIVVIDDKWQLTYGDNQVDERKWPELRGFIASQHARGRKVLLWLKAWDTEGLPAEECIRNTQGRPVSVDPTNPAYERRLRAVVHNLLARDGYDADGFKIDFTARIPSGPGMCVHGDAWGLELMKRYLAIIYSEAKLAKSDSLIMTHTPNPYLADVIDMVRLNDINARKEVNQAMQRRARVARIACPGAIIDTDNWPMPNRKVWRRYVKLQADLGVPSLYFSTHIDASKEPLLEEDYRLIRDVWAAHRKRVQAEESEASRASQFLFALEPEPAGWMVGLRRRFSSRPARS